ncbi:BnaCnng32130D [Brassica napus]|uniref:BnaCnng32130D protein n=1 Tax=Brassica napus TaxID=3708 RepID=A0A078J4Q1_BRANA|nr:BnaCnng32130D [Brassica napus]
MKKNLKKKGKLLSISKDCEVEVSLQEDGFKGSWFRAILEQNPTRVKGKKLRVCHKTLFNEDVERPDGSFFVYFDDPPDIMRFIRSQLRPHADWIGSEWVKSKNKVLSQHMFRTGKLVEMTREISESEKEKIWVRALVITEIQGGDRRNFLIKRCTISQNSSDEAEGKHSIVDICKIRPSPPRDICAEYSLNDYVEVVVTHGWRKGRVTEILLENNYSVEFENNAVTPIRPAQESPSNTLVLESNEDDTVNDDATEIKSSRESYSNTSFLEATETETQNHEPVDVSFKLSPPCVRDLSSSSSVRVCSDTNPQPHLLICEMMSKSDGKIALPKRISEPGTNGGVLDRINKHSNLKLVGKKGLWFSFGEQLMRFSLREFHLAKGLPCVVDKDEEEVETSATKNKKKDPWMKKNQTLNTLLNLLVKKSTELTADQRLRLGATILVEGILMASNPVTSIPEERLLRARNFKEFCKYPWGNLAFDYLRKEVESLTYTKNDEIQFPLCLHWIETKSLTIEEVDVKCILGDPELHSDLVEDVDCLLNIRGETVKIHMLLNSNRKLRSQKKLKPPQKPRLLLNSKLLSYFFCLVILGKEEWCKTSSGVDHQDEDDTEVEHGAKESDTSKVNEEQPQEEEEQQEEDDTEDDVDDGDKESENPETNEDDTEVNADVDVGVEESENPKTNEDGEVNEDASKKSVKGTKKRGRGTKGMKKGVTPPREVQQQVEDDAEVDVGAKEIENPETNEDDAEVNEENGSENPVKGSKKRGRKVNISQCIIVFQF